ncbi:Hypothetical predicted protein [Pelobates cultripes]|uniref:Uncharacterized protein n=1 Tax=Pelobates cultripes TaxID=61616 RepID=A0AAD1SDM4_PELCU|nr:Hypothetical predicted protein [Pelobates cultripes]
MTDIKMLEKLHRLDKSLDTYKTLIAKRSGLTTLLNLQSKYKLLLTKHTYYTQGGKSGLLLAQSLQPKRQTTFISSITPQNGKKSCLVPDIITSFQEFYTKLYNLRDKPPPDHKIREFLSKRNKHTIPRNALEAL